MSQAAWALVAAAAAAAAAALVLPPAGRPARHPLLAARTVPDSMAPDSVAPGRSPGRSPGPPGLLSGRPPAPWSARAPARVAARAGAGLVVGAVVVAVVAVVVADGWGGAARLEARVSGVRIALASILGCAGVALLALRARARAARAAAARRAEVLGYGEALAGELRSGVPVQTALQRAAGVWLPASPVAGAAELGADVGAALRRVGALPGAEALMRLADAWEVCVTSGAGLAAAVDRVVEACRADEEAHRRTEAELSAARATARVVAALPFVVLCASEGLGVGAWHYLLETPPGLCGLAVGLLLTVAGLAWMDGIARAATRSTW